MEDDGYWKDVEKAYADCLMEGMTLAQDEMWEFAKHRTQHRYFLQRVVDTAKREGRDYYTVLREQSELVRQERRRGEQDKLN